MSDAPRATRLLDCHFHWYPQAVEDGLNRVNGNTRRHSADWFDLEGQLARMDALGRRVDVISSTGPFTGLFTGIDAGNSRALTRLYNETMADGQRRHPGRVWGTCVLPLLDTDAALAELEYAVGTLGLVGVNLPGRIGPSDNLDAPRLEALYARIEQLGVPIFVHPNDEAFEPVLPGYDGALHLSLGRVIDVSVSAYRLVLSGLMERHPDLRIAVSHTGGALPYQAGRMDKNSGAAKLPKPPTEYLHRMYTDTVSPHTAGVRFAVEFYGADKVMYGSDYPCWDPDAALRIIDELDLDDDSLDKICYANAYRLYGLDRYASAAAVSPDEPLAATAG
ncbi:MAG TPA: amidohydrolase family protein [Jatrophihabitantaceae bacterium]